MKSVLVALIFILAGCGVKGDPQPPIKPPDLGRGQPTFKEAVKGVETTPVQPVQEEDDDEE